jgi:cytochrome c6
MPDNGVGLQGLLCGDSGYLSGASNVFEGGTMKHLSRFRIGIVILAASLFLLGTSSVHGQSEAEKTYKTKCAACHGADGSGSEVGKKMGTHDFHSSQVQSESEADLAQVVAKGKNKMPSYEKSLKPDEIKALATYVHDLGKK